MSGKRLIAVALLLVGCGGSSPTVPTATPVRSWTATQVPPPSRTPTAATVTPSSTSVATDTPATATIQTATPTPVEPTSTPTFGGATATETPTRPASTPTPTLDPDSAGPLVTYLAMVRPDGCRIGCFAGVCACPVSPTPIVDDMGREVFLAQGGGRGLLVVEGRPGASGLPVASHVTPEEGLSRPDLQMLVSRSMGNGSAEVCDKGQPPPIGMGGGVPAVDPPDFGPGQTITDAMFDLSCRFAVQPTREDACTLDSLGNFDFLGGRSTIQFCNQLATITAFPAGDTVLTARLRDVAGNLGPPAEVVIRNLAVVPTVTPQPSEE